MSRNYRFLPFLGLLALMSCHSRLQIRQVDAEKNIPIQPGMQEDAAIMEVIAPYRKSLESQMNSVISYTSVDLTKTGDNSSLGNLLADYTFDAAQEWAQKNHRHGIDAALINIGGIRSTIGKGSILLRHIFEIMPFENELVIVKIKGKDLNGLFDYYLKSQKNDPVSRIIIETGQGRISKALINGEEVNPDSDYYIATSDYLALGGDNMTFFSKGTSINTGEKLRDLYIQKFKEHPEVIPPDDVRLIFKDKKAE
ncbi:5'-nucleotidase C-terminal domain-containing protein [Daejeonia sp. YH14]|uniref:5'-nucleotidase C-terminal domain-containing protein n=1 Tax=Daejeonia sp. YH14 TaxID=3439042 RepID=UPI003F499406